jgi:vacuolar-type H+-ATPase subunit E/Vma4
MDGLYLDGYGLAIKDFSTSYAAREHAKIEKIIQKFEQVFEKVKGLKTSATLRTKMTLCLDKLKSVEATLDVYSSPHMIASIAEFAKSKSEGNLKSVVWPAKHMS